MRKILTILFLLTGFILFSNEKERSFTITAGTEYLEEDYYFNTGFSALFPLEGDKEFDIKLALNMITEEDKSVIKPYFNIPLKTGINFLFPKSENVTFLTGIGLTTMFRLYGEDNLLIGPHVKGGVRYKVHTTMNLIFEINQSLLIGPPNWMYPSTDITFGVNFFI